MLVPGVGPGGIPGVTGGLHAQLLTQNFKDFGRELFSSRQGASEMLQHSELHGVAETVEVAATVHGLFEIGFAQRIMLCEQTLVERWEAGELPPLGRRQNHQAAKPP